MQSPTYMLLKSSCFAVTDLKSFQLHIILTITFSAVKIFFYQDFVCVSAFKGDLQIGQGGLDFVDFWLLGVVQCFVWQGQFADVILREQNSSYFTVTFPCNTKSTVEPQAPRGSYYEGLWHDLRHEALADMSQAEVWRPATAPVCRWVHHNLNHNPTACKTPSELIREGFNVDKTLSDFVTSYTFSCVASLPVPVSPRQLLSSGIFLMFWHVLALDQDAKSPPQDGVLDFSSETYTAVKTNLEGIILPRVLQFMSQKVLMLLFNSSHVQFMDQFYYPAHSSFITFPLNQLYL